MRWRNLIPSVIRAVEKKTNRTVVVGFVGILQISHKIWDIPEFAVRLQKIRNGVKSRFLYRLLKTNNTPIELLWFRFGVLFILEAPPGRRLHRLSARPIPHDVSKTKTVREAPPGISPSANIRTLYAWQASLPISEWRMRTGFCCARRARRARFDERVAPPTNEKSNPVGLLRSLR